jgi:hypothetical protein
MSDRADRLERFTTIDVEGLGADVRQAVDTVRTRDLPVVLLEDGTPAAVMLSPGRLRHILDERELLRRLAVGELECLGGDGVPLKEVLDECDRLLDEHG